jgi:hypothetical protein
VIVRERLHFMDIRDNPFPPHSPWQNGHAERLIGSIRRECLDHQIILGAGHLRRALKAYAEYYNSDRTHLALAKDSPRSRPVEVDGVTPDPRRTASLLHPQAARMRLSEGTVIATAAIQLNDDLRSHT